MNQFNIIKIYPIFIQQQDTNSIQVPIDCKLGDTGTYPETYNKAQKFHDQKVLKSCRLCSLFTVELCQKSVSTAFENNPHIFKISTLIDEKLGARKGEAAYSNDSSHRGGGWEYNPGNLSADPKLGNSTQGFLSTPKSCKLQQLCKILKGFPCP